jgi:hypothetical protein
MTLTDIISKITQYAKKLIVNDNSSTTAASITQAGTGDALSITGTTGTGASITTTTGTALRLQQNHTQAYLGGTLEIFKSSGDDFVFNGASDGIFTFVNTSSAATKATVFSGANVGIGTLVPLEALDVEGKIRIKNEAIVNGANQTFKFFALNTSNSARWHIGASDTNETGANAGSDFFIHNFNDSGAFISRAFHITRSTGNVGINTSTPAKTLHVNGTVRLQGLPTYANNAAAIAGGLVADDVYKTAAGELRIVV